jgi:hypothetical protein
MIGVTIPCTRSQLEPHIRLIIGNAAVMKQRGSVAVCQFGSFATHAFGSATLTLSYGRIVASAHWPSRTRLWSRVSSHFIRPAPSRLHGSSSTTPARCCASRRTNNSVAYRIRHMVLYPTFRDRKDAHYASQSGLLTWRRHRCEFDAS